jgi:hypothetical protein
VTWEERDGATFAARAVPITAETGAFRFRGADNLEVGAKVLDGRVVNGHFWLFWGGMTDRAVTVRVVDTEGLQVRSYDGPAGVRTRAADVAAFPD